MCFDSWGDPANRENREVRNVEKRVMTAHGITHLKNKNKTGRKVSLGSFQFGFLV
jgi:hypothetical protein